MQVGEKNKTKQFLSLIGKIKQIQYSIRTYIVRTYSIVPNFVAVLLLPCYSIIAASDFP